MEPLSVSPEYVSTFFFVHCVKQVERWMTEQRRVCERFQSDAISWARVLVPLQEKKIGRWMIGVNRQKNIGEEGNLSVR